MSRVCVKIESFLFIMIDVKEFGLISNLKSFDLTITVVSCFISYF